MDKSAKEFLEKLGLTQEESLLYLTLLTQGPLTMLDLSRQTNINRTRVYRLVENLNSQGLTQEIIDSHRKLAKASGIHILERLVHDRESKARQLIEELPAIKTLFSAVTQLAQPGTKVLFYRGKEGILQQVWNTLRSEGELLGYSYRPLVELIGNYEKIAIRGPLAKLDLSRQITH